ncbi:MAG: N-6 DNA methylase [Desulfurellaceae bacterium]|nr:N-6 DNA methylase [Desulfurellaceae bacterium]
MDVAQVLGYEGSPNFLSKDEDFPHSQLGYVLRKAREECGLQGVYVLGNETGNMPTIPIVYFCKSSSESEAAQIHRRIWNQGLVPFVLVQTPQCIRLYSGFHYSPPAAEQQEEGVLKAAVAFNKVSDQLAAFTAQAIDDGTLWQEWGEQINPKNRVDWRLLEELKKLDDHLQKQGVGQNISHALIGKFVYFRYLRDRNILSDRKLDKWRIPPKSVFSRHATRKGFLALNKEIQKWLNGSIFLLESDALDDISPSLLQQVAGIFCGDTVEGQLHLDFQPYDFSFIPIETLSVIYEQFLHLPVYGQNVTRGRESGAYYTPLPLVDFIQSELEQRHPLTQSMKVLDPSCGSGAFLVQCYRQLIEKRRYQEQRQLRPKELRDILTSQIYGVDRDGDACHIAEMSLILTLLDYVTPPDLESTSFQLPNLRNANIFKADFFAPDSLWEEVAATKKFDWIIGNPPWISLSSQRVREEDRPVWEWMRENYQEAPTGGNQVAEAFVWKVLPYLEKNGIAGLVLPAMTLFKKESASFRKQFFTKVQAWCVANFSNLSEVLFAGRSRRPCLTLFFQRKENQLDTDWAESILTYSPFVINQEANRPNRPEKRKDTWTITINAAEVQEVSLDRAATGATLPWKIAMWGSFRDGKLLERIERKFPIFSDFAKVHGLHAHQGLELREGPEQSREPLEVRPELEGKKRADFTKLGRIGRIFVFPDSAVHIIPKELTYVRKGRADLPMRVSTPPHILLDVGRRFAIYSDEFLAVPARQIGIAAQPGKESLLKALSLYLSSDFVVYQQFFTSSQWGIDTDIATLDSLKSLPVPLERLSVKEIREWAALRDALAKISPASLESELEEQMASNTEQALTDKMVELNERVFQLLGLREDERILVQDFVTTNMQCVQGKVAKAALNPPSKSLMKSYLQLLKKELDTFIAGQTDARHEITAFHDARSTMIAVKLAPPNATQHIILKYANEEMTREWTRIREHLYRRHSQWVYFNRNLRIYDNDTTYCFKPMHTLQWTRRQALLDAGEVIAETLVAEENS